MGHLLHVEGDAEGVGGLRAVPAKKRSYFSMKDVGILGFKEGRPGQCVSRAVRANLQTGVVYELWICAPPLGGKDSWNEPRPSRASSLCAIGMLSESQPEHGALTAEWFRF